MTEKIPTKILEFLEGKGTGAKGRNLDEIIDQDDECWSHQHDFIQWLFLLNGNSLAVPKSPILEDSEIINFRESLVAQALIDRDLERYRQFLKRNKELHSRHDHNYLYITRVVKCLKLLRDLEITRQSKYWIAGKLGDAIDNINEQIKRYWREIQEIVADESQIGFMKVELWWFV